MIRHLIVATSLLVLLAYAAGAQGHIYTKAAPSGPDWTTTSSTWVDIKDLDLWFYQYYAGPVCIGISAECNAVAGKRLAVRAIVDGDIASPSDVIFASEGDPMCRMFQFSASVGQGMRHVKFQTLVDGGGTAYFGDRTMWVITAPSLANVVAAPSGANLTTNSSAWSDIANMTLNLNVPATGPLVLAFSSEMVCDNSTRAFVRAIVDGAAASPSDAIIASGSVMGAYGMTFHVPSVPAGSHTVKMQWSASGPGTCTMGDRTVAVMTCNPSALVGGKGGVMSTSPPSGPDVSTTAGYWGDIPGMSLDISVPENATLAITLRGEAEVSGGGMFIRATVDGAACCPSDVEFRYGAGFLGTASMTFLQKNVAGGTRHVALQWHTAGGLTAYLGDRNLTVVALPCAGPDITDGFQAVKPVLGTVPLLVLLWDPQRPTDPAPALGTVVNLLHGTYPSVADYFKVNSANNFAISNAGIFGWFKSDKPYTYYWGPEDSLDADHDGFTSGHVRKWWEAVTKADPSFNFAAYDVNNDGVLDPTELGVVMVIPQNGAFGTVSVPASQQYPTWAPLVVDGVRIPFIAEVYAGSPPNLGAFAHEISHLVLNLPDMYFTFFFPYAAGHYSIMDVSYIDSHIDAFHKIHLGWLQPTVVRQNGKQFIYPVEMGGGAYILMDPKHGEKEYFIVENRQRLQRYDTQMADSGLAVWHVMEDPTVYGALPAPTGVSVTEWAKVPPKDWGRRAIRMIRPIYGPPFDDKKGLWDGADPATGYDLLSSDSNPAHAKLQWADGSPSGFGIRMISPATGVMDVTFELPASATGVMEQAPTPAGFTLFQNFPNPFNPSTTIRYGLPERSNVSLEVYNTLGQQVAILQSGEREAGYHDITFNASNLPSGVYFYRLKAGSFVQTCKLCLVR